MHDLTLRLFFCMCEDSNWKQRKTNFHLEIINSCMLRLMNKCNAFCIMGLRYYNPWFVVYIEVILLGS